MDNGDCQGMSELQHRQLLATVATQKEEIARLHRLAKANNDLARARWGDVIRLCSHIETMQGMASRYLEPTAYKDLGGHHAGLNPADRDYAFICDIIYMLDGPEQRALPNILPSNTWVG